MRCSLLGVREGFPYAVQKRREAATGEVDAEIAVQPLDEHDQLSGATALPRHSLDALVTVGYRSDP